MKRDLAQLARDEYDVLVIGGGIYGACVAWDASLRGLSVALVERGDFGQATSANSLKIIHGGLRYVQDANLKRVRTMSREQATWLRIAPHLVQPLPCLMPTYSKLTRSKAAMAAALAIKRLAGYDSNGGLEGDRHLPAGRIVSRDECLRLAPALPSAGLTGGLLWYDAQMVNSERLLLSFILSAAQMGAVVANYVEVAGFLQHRAERSVVRGVLAKDVLSGAQFPIQAKVVINCAGAWADVVLGLLHGNVPSPKIHLSTATNLVTRQILPRVAIGVVSPTAMENGSGRAERLLRRPRLLFIVPWQGVSIIGTIHAPFSGRPEDDRVTEAVIEDFVAEINAAYPGAALRREDVYHVHRGFLPARPVRGQTEAVRLVREGSVHDHEREDRIAGLITVVGVKYTTVRHIAQKAVDLAVKKLGCATPPCRTHETPIYGGHIERFDDFLSRALAQRPDELGPQVVRRLVHSYGSEYRQILGYLEEHPAWRHTITETSAVIRAEVVHAVREEMAQKLTDVIQRRTEPGAVGMPDEGCLQACADIMAAELGWDRVRRAQEIDGVRVAYALTKSHAGEEIRVY